MTVSATLAADEAVAARRAAGQEVMALGFGEAGIPVHPLLSQRLAQAAGRIAYGPVAGTPEAREAAAGYWSRRGLPTEAGQVLIGPGSKPILFALQHAVGGDVVLPRPAWVSYAAQSQLLGREPIRVPVPAGEGGVPDAELMDAAVRQARAEGRDPRLVVATLPDNPTGRLASEAAVKALCAKARELDLVIVADEIYRDLVFKDGPFPSPAQWAPERTVTTTALSKNYAVGGWRIGAVRFPDSELGQELQESVRGVASELWSSASLPMQHAAAYAWSDPAELVDRVAMARRLHGAVANAVAEAFASVGCDVLAPQGGFYVWPDFAPLRAILAERWGVRTSADLARVLLEEFGIVVIGGHAFGDACEPNRRHSGDDPAALTIRVAVPGIYGESDSERLAALLSNDPLEMPWIAETIEGLREKLKALVALAPVLGEHYRDRDADDHDDGRDSEEQRAHDALDLEFAAVPDGSSPAAVAPVVPAVRVVADVEEQRLEVGDAVGLFGQPPPETVLARVDHAAAPGPGEAVEGDAAIGPGGPGVCVHDELPPVLTTSSQR